MKSFSFQYISFLLFAGCLLLIDPKRDMLNPEFTSGLILPHVPEIPLLCTYICKQISSLNCYVFTFMSMNRKNVTDDMMWDIPKFHVSGVDWVMGV